MRIAILLVVFLLATVGGAAAGWFLKGDGEAAAASAETPDPLSYVELQNQFVVPLTSGNAISGLVAVSLAIEAREGEEATILDAEPRLRDAFLRVLFDHARAAGFEGDFTQGSAIGELRTRLSAAATDALGPAVHGVLITSVTRQDF